MAIVLIPDDRRTLDDPAEISAFLAPFGIAHQRWPLEERVDPNAAPEEILAAYAPEIEALKAQGGYVTADVISVTSSKDGDKLVFEALGGRMGGELHALALTTAVPR